MKRDPSAGHAVSIERDLDIRNERCPMTLVRTRLALDRLNDGQVLRVRLGSGEPAQSVPGQAASLGHEVLEVRPTGDGDVLVLVRCRRSPAEGAT